MSSTNSAAEFYGPWTAPPYNLMVGKVVSPLTTLVEPSRIDQVLARAAENGLENTSLLRTQLLRTFEVTMARRMPVPNVTRLQQRIECTDREYRQLEERYRVEEQAARKELVPRLKKLWNQQLALNGLRYVHIDKVSLPPKVERDADGDLPVAEPAPSSSRSPPPDHSETPNDVQLESSGSTLTPHQQLMSFLASLTENNQEKFMAPSHNRRSRSRSRCGTSMPREMSDRRPVLTALNGIYYHSFSMPTPKTLFVTANHIPHQYEFCRNPRATNRFHCIECRRRKCNVRALLTEGAVYSDGHVCTPDLPPNG